jgi:hypothetical protein
MTTASYTEESTSKTAQAMGTTIHYTSSISSRPIGASQGFELKRWAVLVAITDCRPKVCPRTPRYRRL